MELFQLQFPHLGEVMRGWIRGSLGARQQVSNWSSSMSSWVALWLAGSLFQLLEGGGGVLLENEIKEQEIPNPVAETGPSSSEQKSHSKKGKVLIHVAEHLFVVRTLPSGRLSVRPDAALCTPSCWVLLTPVQPAPGSYWKETASGRKAPEKILISLS